MSAGDYKIASSLSGTTITATATGPSGNPITGSLDLNTVIGNVNGTLAWGGSNFANGAQNFNLDDGFTLAANLPDSNGNMVYSELIIGAGVSDFNGKDAIKFGFLPPYSQAHAVANTNAEADQAAHAQLTAANGNIKQTTTLQGDASTYWPNGNAPASGSAHSWHIAIEWIHFAIEIIECFE